MFIKAIDKTKNKIYTLNALRGFSALFVAFYHMVGYGKFLDPGYLPASFKYFYDNGHFRVLIFFVISGYVITLSNKTNLSIKTLPNYIKKRALRIYPIYFASLILTLFVLERTYSFFTIVGNFTFLQVLFTEVIAENGPIWTLHYEILFYLIFIPISMFGFNPLKAFALSLGIGIANFFLYPYLHAPIITSYCFGFAFWSLGMVIVKYFSTKNTQPVNYTRLVSFLFLTLSIPYLNQMDRAIYKYEHIWNFPTLYPDFFFNGDINKWFKAAFVFTDLAYLPYCFMAVILFSERNFRFRNIILLLLQLVPAYTLYVMYKEGGYLNFDKMIFPVVCYFISCILLIINFEIIRHLSGKVIKFFIWMGGISYGVYIVHSPVLYFFNQIHFFSGSAFTFSIRLILYFFSTFLLAFFLEYIYQNRVLEFLKNKKVILLKDNLKAILIKKPILK